jgi:hypothetical protein
MANELTGFDAARATPMDTQATLSTKPRARLNADGSWIVFGGGNTDWFGPGNPIPPLAPPEQGFRQYDYQVAQNQAYAQKRTPNALPYSQLYYFATYYDLARLLIERRKNQIAKLEWNIQPRDQKKKQDARCDQIAAFLRRPDGENFWQQWIKKLLNDMIVYDAAFIYPLVDQRGRLLSLEVPDGTTFKFLIDERGLTPKAPWPAYQQILKGVPGFNFTRDELFFMPFNPTNERVGGYSVIEQIVVTITMALSNQASQLSYFTNGATPDMILSVPEGWTPAQVKEFKQWWDSLLQGNLQQRRGTMFVFNGMNPINTKEAVIKTPLDEWIARVMCFAFGISPAPFVAQMNRATAESAAEQAKEEGIGPVMDWVRAVMDHIIDVCFGASDLSFRWQEEDETDPKTKAETNEIKFRNGALKLNEWREQDGLDPDPNGNELMIVTASGATLLKDVLNPPEPPPALALPPGQEAPPPSAKPKPGGDDPAAKAAGASADDGPFEKRKARAQNPAKADVAALAEPIHAVLQKLGRAIAKRLAHRLGKASDPDIDSWLADLDFSDLAALTEILDSGIATMGERAFSEAVLEVGGALDNMLAIGLPNTRAVQYAEQRAAALIGSDGGGGELAQATRDMLRSTVADALSNAQTVDELQQTLEDNYAFSADRAETIARTELKSAMSAGNAEGWRASGVVTGKQWQVSNDDVCDICLDNEAAGVIGLDEPFPSGDDMPGAHPNCNCAVFPVVDNSED